MSSTFDPRSQHQFVEDKIIASVERLSQVLRQLLRAEMHGRGLSPIQVQLLVYLAFHPPEFCRVSYLAREFQLTQPTVSDAVNALIRKELVEKEPLPQDRRISILRLTEHGRAIANDLADWADDLKPYLADALSNAEREALMWGLMKWIAALERGGVISVARMCFTCRFFQEMREPHSPEPHYCHLLGRPLSSADLRLDCLDYERIPG